MYFYSFSVILLLVSVFIYWLSKKYSYWSNKGIKGPSPLPIVGNFLQVMTFQISLGDLLKKAYFDYANEKVVGIYQGLTPVLLLRDPEVIKTVLVKDFPIFQDRGIKRTDDPLDEHLVAVEGEKWRILRQKLTPIFTSGKLKSMLPIVVKSAEDYIKYIDGLIQNDVDHEIRSLAAKYTLEVIGSCAFGVDLDVFSVKKNVFRDIATQIFSPPTFSRILQFLDFIVPGIENLSRKVGLGGNAKVTSFFIKLVKEIINEREGKPKVRKDFMDLMIELKEQGVVQKREEEKVSKLDMNDNLIAAQALIFYAAGFETSAATMSFLIYELALNQEIQERLHNEVKRIIDNNNGVLSYEILNEMTYLEMVLDETLRKYPIANLLIRKCSKTYDFIDPKLQIDAGVSVMISLNGLLADPQYFPNPEVFDPERFSPERKAKIHPFVYLPFGEGPRHCIGLRFAKVQSMIGIAAFIRNFKVEPSRKTLKQLTFDPKAFTLTSAKGIWVKISRR